MTSITRTIRAGALALCCGLLLVASSPAWSQGDSASKANAALSEVMDQVLAVAHNRDLDSSERRNQIEQIAIREFAWTTMSRLVLARNWRKLSDTQQHEFVDAFQNHLAIVYGRRLEQIHDEQIEISPGRMSNGSKRRSEFR